MNETEKAIRLNVKSARWSGFGFGNKKTLYGLVFHNPAVGFQSWGITKLADGWHLTDAMSNPIKKLDTKDVVSAKEFAKEAILARVLKLVKETK